MFNFWAAITGRQSPGSTFIATRDFNSVNLQQVVSGRTVAVLCRRICMLSLLRSLLRKNLANRSNNPPRLLATMPPKRVAKRKAAASESSGDEAESSKAPKKSKTSQDALTDIAPNGQPTNKVLPTRISFPPRTPGILRLAAWNVCGLAASQKKVPYSRGIR